MSHLFNDTKQVHVMSNWLKLGQGNGELSEKTTRQNCLEECAQGMCRSSCRITSLYMICATLVDRQTATHRELRIDWLQYSSSQLS